MKHKNRKDFEVVKVLKKSTQSKSNSSEHRIDRFPLPKSA